jgi:FAD-linked oxidoreductase
MGIAQAEGMGMTEWRNWSGSVVSHPATIARPQDEAQLAAIVREATRLRVAGAGHSFTPLCETDETLVSLADMEGDLVICADRRSIEAPAGWSLKRLTEALWEQGLSLPNQGDVNSQSFAGALATGTHGTGRDLASLSSLAEGFRLVTASGDIVNCDRDLDPDLFEAQRLSLGLLGVATRARVRVVPAFHLEERIERRPLEDVLEQIDELAAATRHVEFFLFPYANQVLLKTLHPCEDTGVELPAAGDDAVFQACCDLAAAAPRAVPLIQRSLTRMWRPSTRSGPSWRIFPGEREVRFEEMEYEVPIAHAVAALREVVARVRSERMPLIFPIEFRLVDADDIWLSPFNGGACASISVHQYAPMPWAEAFADLETILRRHGGRPHWAKRHNLSADDVLSLYPGAANFGRVRKSVDPEAKFMNAHTAQLFSFSL